MRLFAALISLLLLLAAPEAAGQRVFTLDEAIAVGLDESYQVSSARLSLESSQKTLESIKLGLRTNVDVEFDLPRYRRSLQSQFNVNKGSEEFFDLGQTVLEGRLNFTQPIVFTDGTFQLSGSFFGRDQFGGSVDGTQRDYYSNLSFRLRQPLFTFNELDARLERAEINLNKAERNYSKAERDIVYNVTSSFFELFKAKKQHEISLEKQQQTRESFETSQNKFKAGLIAEVEMLQLEVDYASAQNDVLNAETSYASAKNNFKLLLNLPLDEDIDVEGEVDYTPISVDADEAVTFALQNRPELENAESDIELNRLSVEERDANGSISGMLTANYGINKNAPEVEEAFRNFSEDRSVTFTLQVPVWDWGRNARSVEAAAAQLKQSQLDYRYLREEIKSEIIRLVDRLRAARARVEVLSKSVEVAQKSYEISVERFNAGKITSFDLSQMQLRLTDAKVNSLNALIDYKLALADLTRKTFHDFEND